MHVTVTEQNSCQNVFRFMSRTPKWWSRCWFGYEGFGASFTTRLMSATVCSCFMSVVDRYTIMYLILNPLSSYYTWLIHCLCGQVIPFHVLLQRLTLMALEYSSQLCKWNAMQYILTSCIRVQGLCACLACRDVLCKHMISVRRLSWKWHCIRPHCYL